MNITLLQPWLPVLLALLVVLLLVFFLQRLFRNRRPTKESSQEDLHIDLASLDTTGPPAGPVRLEVYGTAVHVRVLIVAPSGRHQAALHPDDLPILLDQFMPGMSDILTLHQPIRHCWPEQLSSKGFAQSFFNLVALPGNRGKGTPWTSLTGRFQAGNQVFLLGIVCCTGDSNSLSQFFVEHEGQWFDMVRIRQDVP